MLSFEHIDRLFTGPKVLLYLRETAGDIESRNVAHDPKPLSEMRLDKVEH